MLLVLARFNLLDLKYESMLIVVLLHRTNNFLDNTQEMSAEIDLLIKKKSITKIKHARYF